MIERSLFNADHEAFRDSFRRFMDKEIAPFHAQWEEQGYVDREVWRKAGANGFLCMTMPEAYGGAGVDKLYSVLQMEELCARRLQRHRLRPAQRDRGAVHPALRHRGAEDALPAEAGQRRDGRRDRDERAGGRLRPAGREDAPR